MLFDVDGTLVTFKFDVQGARGALIDELSRSGLEVSSLSRNSRTQEIMDTARMQLESSRQGSDFASLRERLYRILDKYEEESARETEVFPETRDTLMRLRERSIRLAVLTNSGRKAAFTVLRRANVLDCFEFVLTREDVESMKPSPEGVLEAVRRFSLPKTDVYYVGDGILDIVAARGAGLKVVSVATGIYPPDRLRREGADFVISSLSELPSVLSL